MQYWWWADPHIGHRNMIDYMSRPYKSIEEHDEALIGNVNAVVDKGDLLIIAGDLTLRHKKEWVYKNIVDKLNGTKIIVKGNHDYWLGKGKGRYIYHKKINGTFTVTSHYAMRVWNRSHRGAIQLHGHSHGSLQPWDNQLDVGVDNAYKLLGEYRPFSFDEIKQILKQRKDMSLWKKIVQRYVQAERMERHD